MYPRSYLFLASILNMAIAPLASAQAHLDPESSPHLPLSDVPCPSAPAPGMGVVFISTGSEESKVLSKQKQSLEKKRTSSVGAERFILTGPKIAYGGNGFIGWWYTKDSYATVPVEFKAKKGSQPSKGTEFEISANVAAAKQAGGQMKVVFSQSPDPAKPAVKEWIFEMLPTGRWGQWRTDILGKVTIEKAGKYYLHLLMHKPGEKGFLDIREVAFGSASWDPFEMHLGPVRNTKKAAKSSLKKGNNLDAKALNPMESKATFTLADGFVAELVAGEAQGVVKPISIAFDDRGRLWTQTAREYPADGNHQLFAKGGSDQILYFDQPWKQGLQKPKVFADGLVMPNSVLPWGDSVFAVHGPELLQLSDTDGDGVADQRKALAKGFGIQDTHTNIHQLTRTAGGWITLSQGCNAYGNVTLSNGKKVPFNRARVGRIRPDGTELEILSAGLNNIWCWPVTREGRTFIHEANDFGYSHIVFEQDSSYPSFVRGKRYKDSPLYPPAAQGLNLGGTGFSGLVIAEDTERGFPAPWQGKHFVINPITGSINTVSTSKDEKGVFHFKKEQDLLTSGDKMFRPVAAAFGPDGCLYVIDWYNRIISHNEVPVDHPSRDRVSGRIWRIRHQSQKTFAGLDMTKVEDKQLTQHLASGNPWQSKAAWHQIVDRKAKHLIPALIKQLKQTKDGGTKVLTLWTLEGLGYFDEAVWQALLADENENVRREAVRSLTTLQPGLQVVMRLVAGRNEDSYYVLNQIARFFRDTPFALKSQHIEYLKSLKKDLSKSPKDKVKGWRGEYYTLGGAYEDRFLNLLLDKAVIQDRGQSTTDEARWNKLLAEHPKKTTKQQQAMQQQIEGVLEYGKTHAADLAKGKSSFQQRCALCHDAAMGAKAFAPALNGGKARDAEGILVAVLNPNAAVESVFQSYRVVKKDGQVIEGFRSGLDVEAITLMYMGGATLKIPLKEVKSAGYVKDKSVMPEGMAGGMSEQDLNDLIGYIQSIK